LEGFALLPKPELGGGTLLTSPSVMRKHTRGRPMNCASMLLGSLRRVLNVLSVRQKRVAGRHALSTLDNHVLWDIDLTRSDVELELMKPFWRI
jgi:uncharacterized protein YjiS (DUF1127 family)